MWWRRKRRRGCRGKEIDLARINGVRVVVVSRLGGRLVLESCEATGGSGGTEPT